MLDVSREEKTGVLQKNQLESLQIKNSGNGPLKSMQVEVNRNF